MTKKVVDKLTPEQEARIPAMRDEWLRIGTSCEPADFDACKRAADKAYRTAGLQPPPHYMLTDSPISCAVLAARLTAGKEKMQDGYVKVDIDNVSTAMWAKAEAELQAQVYGSHDAGWLSFYSFMSNVVGLKEECAPLEGLMDLAKVCGWWAPYEECAIFQHRHTQLHRDEDGELHCEDGPAVLYRDGFSVYAVHGHRVPGWIIDTPKTITVAKIKAEENAETRRIMRERYGEGRYLADIGAKVIDADSVPVDALAPKGGSIQRALIEDDEGQRTLVGSDGSTKRVYYMPVPRTIKTCQEAHAALAGVKQDRIILEA